MPIPADPSGPAALRYSRTPKALVAATIATTGIATVASGALDRYQSGDLCTIVDVAPGTKLTGQMTSQVDALYYINKISATTAQLVVVATGVAAAGSVAVSAGAALQFGSLGTEIKSANIVASGSVAGGGFGTPLD